MKVGRNEPCPCGSGKKYKKCCLAKDEQDWRAESEKDLDGPFGGNRAGTSFEQIARDLHRQIMITPYSVAKMCERPGEHLMKDRRMRLATEWHLRENWTIAKIAAMTTEEIVDQLMHDGAAITQADFIKSAANRQSAWSISEKWRNDNALRCEGKEEDFLGLAACELWKRWLPEHPSTEMIDDWMQEGYELFEKNEETKGVEIWHKTWLALRERFAPGMTTFNATESVFQGIQSVYNWSQDFSMNVRNAALHNRECVEIGRSFCAELLAQFPDADESIQVSFREDLAHFLCLQGQVEQGLAQLNEVVERWPENIWGYIFLADVYGHAFGDQGVPPNHVKAQELLERGFTKARDREERRILKDRRELLRERALQAGG